jgi:hypothetical protein
MAKTWILDTETKGTGAHVVPLEKLLKKPSREEDLAVVAFERPSRATKSIEPLAPLKFKIVDVRSSRVLGEDLSTRETVDLLDGVRSIVDIRTYVWMRQAERWRLLTLDEERALWQFRGRAPVAASS